MNLDALVSIKLKNELIEYFKEEFKLLDKDNLLKSIDKKIRDNKITIDPIIHKNIKEFRDNQSVRMSERCSDERCSARIMGERYSDERCSYKSKLNSEYCKNHEKRIDDYGYLAFKRYDEERPLINEKANKIPWRDTSAMEDIDTVIQYQNMKLYKLIK